MTNRPIVSILLALLALTGYSGCAESEQAAIIKQNLSSAQIRVDRFESGGDTYVLKGTVLGSTPVGGAVNLVETGQEISLTPYFPSGKPNPEDPDHSRLLTLTSVPPGSTIRCRISLDQQGAWRIISLE